MSDTVVKKWGELATCRTDPGCYLLRVESKRQEIEMAII